MLCLLVGFIYTRSVIHCDIIKPCAIINNMYDDRKLSSNYHFCKQTTSHAVSMKGLEYTISYMYMH